VTAGASSNDALFSEDVQGVLREVVADEGVAAQFNRFLSERDALIKLIVDASSGRLAAVEAAGESAENGLVGEVIARANQIDASIDQSHVTAWLDSRNISLSQLVVR